MLAVAILVLGVLSRLMVHAPNFTPVIALALFGGVYLSRKYAWYVPLLLMVVSDLLLGLHATIPFTWGSILLITFLGMRTSQNKKVTTIFGSSLASAVLFFVITNFGAWLTMYPHTLEGLRTCYIAAIPFFRNELISTLGYSVVLFGLYETVAVRVSNTQLAHVLLATR
jgi:hypothetical protein